MDDTARGAARQLAARDTAHGFGRPVGAHVGEELRAAGEQVQQEHRHAVERVILRSEGNRAADAVPVERRIEDGLREVAVGTEVGPLALALESAGDGVVAGSLLLEAHAGEDGVALHQVAENHRHLDHVGPDGILLFAREAEVGRVAVLAFTALAVALDPGHGAFVLLVVVDAQLDAALDFRAVDRLVAHVQILLEEGGIGHRAGNTHRDRADGEVRLAAELHHGDGGAAEAQQFLAHVGRDGPVVEVLHVASVDAEGGQPLLVVARKRRGEVDGSRTLRAVEAPDGLGHERVHVDGLGAVAPAGGHREDRPDARIAELFGRGGSLGHAADGRIGQDALDGGAVLVAQRIVIELRDAARHGHGHLLERFADSVAAAVDDGTDSNFGMVGIHDNQSVN